MIMIDKLSYSSKLRYKSPCLKSFFAISTLIICVAARSFIISLITLLIMGGLTVYNSRTSYKYYIKLFMLPLLFLLFSTITIIVNIADEPMSTIALPIFHKFIMIRKDSIYFAINLILTSLGSISCLFFLSLTTPSTDLLYVLERIHCPYLIIELLLLIYRFIFVVLDMATAISTSQKCRLGNKDMKTSIKSMSELLTMLLIRALKKSSLLYDAMESRCYDGTIRVLNESNKASKREVISVTIFEVIMIGICFVQRSFYG